MSAERERRYHGLSKAQNIPSVRRQEGRRGKSGVVLMSGKLLLLQLLLLFVVVAAFIVSFEAVATGGGGGEAKELPKRTRALCRKTKA